MSEPKKTKFFAQCRCGGGYPGSCKATTRTDKVLPSHWICDDCQAGKCRKQHK